jgi:hypothetical protein
VKSNYGKITLKMGVTKKNPDTLSILPWNEWKTPCSYGGEFTIFNISVLNY